MKFRTTILGAIAAFMLATPASAVLVGVAGLASTGDGAGGGTLPAIIAAPGDVNDDAATNTGMEGFNEMIGFLLLAPLGVDGGMIAAGTRVDSHMIFLNSEGQSGNNHQIEHANVDWTFDGEILGIMTDTPGTLEFASSSFLGAMGTTYPGGPLANRGLEGMFDFAGFLAGSSVLTTSFRVTEPGDWIRVITVSQVPLPAALPLFAGGLGLMGLFARRRKHKALTA